MNIDINAINQASKAELLRIAQENGMHIPSRTSTKRLREMLRAEAFQHQRFLSQVQVLDKCPIL